MRNKFLLSLFFGVIIALFGIMPVSQSVFAETPYNPVPYEDIGSILEQHAKDSDRVTLEVIGKSAQGHDLYGVVISNSENSGDLEKSKTLRTLMIEDPKEAQEFVDENPDVKVPFMINGSVHGNEYAGTDAVLKLIDRFGYANDDTTMSILESNIIVINVVANPDGRILGTRANSEGYDLNRDFVTIAQPETSANIDFIKEWLPMVHLDLHGYVKRSDDYPGLIEPTTGPHNPNTEHDIYIKWGLEQAKAMERELVSNKDEFETPLYKGMKGTHIPYRDAEDGWDDYPPIFTPGHTMYQGAYVATLETPNNSTDGVDWHYHAVMGALKYATENRMGMLEDQIEVFRRGVEFDHPDHEAGFFPKAYILPMNHTDPSATIQGAKRFLKSGIKVHKADESFTVDGITYDKGTYIVKMNQAMAGLANTLLWDGEDITDKVNAMYDISGWSLPELWGFDAIATDSTIDIPVTEVENIDIEGELVGEGPYEITNSSVSSIVLVNKLIKNNLNVYKASNGKYYVEKGDGDILSKAAQQTSGLILNTKAIPKDAKKLGEVNVAILKDNGHGTRTALRELGFEVSEILPQEIADNGLSDYDVLVVNGKGRDSDESYKQNIHEFVLNGGKYIAIGSNASSGAVELGLADARVISGGTNSNGIVEVNYKDTTLTAGYAEQGFGFVYNPVWYMDVEDDRVVANYADQDFFKAGFWKNSQAGQGQRSIIKGHFDTVTLLGLEVGFRDHPKNLFRLLSNAIYPGDGPILTTVTDTKKRVERYEDEFANSSTMRLLQTHLTSVGHYESNGAMDKAIKHMKSFKILIEQMKEKELVSTKLFNILNSDADLLLKKWE